MSTNRRDFLLTDVQKREYVVTRDIVPADVGGSADGYKVTKQRLGGGLSDGVDIISVNNGLLRFEIVPTRGMGLWKAWLGDTEYGWKSPAIGPVHPREVPLLDPNGLGWLEGFDELLCRCGLIFNGGPAFNDNGTLKYGLHGNIANRPAHYVMVSINGDTGEITVKGVVDEQRLFFHHLRMTTEIKTRVGEPWLTITDTVQNRHDADCETVMLYHTNVGSPWLKPGAKITAPIKRMAPRDKVVPDIVADWHTCRQKEAGTPEEVFFFELASDDKGRTGVVLSNPDDTQAFGVRCNVNQLPCFTLWENPAPTAQGFVTGLEPGTRYPIPTPSEGKNPGISALEPEGLRRYDLTLQFHDGGDAVAAAKDAVMAFQTAEPTIHESPLPEWSAA